MRAILKIFTAAALVGSMAFGSAQAQDMADYADAQSCLDHVQELENQSLSADLNAEEFNMLIELLVEATDLCRANALVDAKQQLENAVDMIEANS